MIFARPTAAMPCSRKRRDAASRIRSRVASLCSGAYRIGADLFLLYLDHDLTSCSSSLHVGQRFIGRVERKHLVQHRADDSSIDERSDPLQLVAARFHEEKGESGLEAFCLSPRAEAQQPGDELHEPCRDRKSTRLNSSHVKTTYAV